MKVNFGSTAGVCVCVCVRISLFPKIHSARIKMDSEMNEAGVALPRVQV